MGSSVYGLIPGFIFFTIFVAFLLFAWLDSKNQKVIKYFEGKYKQDLVNFLLEGKNFKYNKNAKISQQDFEASNLYGYFNRYSGEDLLSIVLPSAHGDLSIAFSDLDVEHVSRDKDGNTSTTTVFNGIFGFVELEKTFNFDLGVNKSLSRQHFVSLESTEFNKHYKVYCTDQIAARLIFTPDRMQKLLSLKTFTKIGIKQNQNRIYFGFGGQHLFKTQIYNQSKQINVDDFYNDIYAFNVFIEHLKKVLDDIF